MKPALTITDASAHSDAALCAAMNDAFSDYALPVNLSEDGFARMMKQRGLTRGASRVASVDGNIAAIWLVAVRGAASYLISSGTRPAWRSRGIARSLAVDCLTGLRAQGIASFQTEVLENNGTAQALYVSLGMTPERKLTCYQLQMPAVDTPNVTLDPWPQTGDPLTTLQDWQPTWQNSTASLAKIHRDVTLLQVRRDDHLIAGAALIPATGTLAQIAVHSDHRRQGIGTALMAAAQRLVPDGALRLINIDAADSAFAAFMHAHTARQTIGQNALYMAL